jgi:hypothetical protein
VNDVVGVGARAEVVARVEQDVTVTLTMNEESRCASNILRSGPCLNLRILPVAVQGTVVHLVSPERTTNNSSEASGLGLTEASVSTFVSCNKATIRVRAASHLRKD